MLMWQISLDDYINICEISKKLEIQPGESMEMVINEYMKAKGIKSTVTDFTQDEIIERLTENGKKILHIQTDEDGEQDIRFIQKDEDTLKSD